MTIRSGVLLTALSASVVLFLAGCGSAPSSGSGSNSSSSSGSNSNSGSSSGTQAQPPALLVADTLNNRLLIFDSPLDQGKSAATALGQLSFTTSVQATTASGFLNPGNAVLDAQGNIWVSDSGNNRVLRFSPPFTNGMAANLVLGQPNFTSNTGTTSLSGLSLPHGLVFDKTGNLWIADSYSGRVLEFSPPFSNDMAASLVLGQPPFNSGVCIAPPSASTLCFPSDVTFDASGNLWVVDDNNWRVLEFTPPFISGHSASIVLGQQDFASKVLGAGATGLNTPWSAASDNSGNLWVTDGGNWRVLEFSPPFSNGQSASLVLGFPNFTATVNNNPQSNMMNPRGLAFDGVGHLFVADSGGSRVLEFNPPFSNGMAAVNVLGQLNLTTVGAAAPPTSSSLANPGGIFVSQ